jgi:hypothetical protein
MREVYFGVLADPLVRAAADADGTSPPDWITAARGAATVTTAGPDAGTDPGALLLFVDRPTPSVAAAAVIGAAARAVSADPPAAASATEFHSDATLASWERAPGGVPPGATPRIDASDGRWFWILVLVLLGIETLVRRRRPKAAETAEVDVARVA